MIRNVALASAERRTPPSEHDPYAEARAVADAEFVRQLVTVRFGPTVRGIALIWVQLALAWSIALLAPPPMALVSVVIVCACQQGMLLWVHEASHGTLARAQNRSDFWIDLLVATPIGMTVRGYRTPHLSHHAFLGTSRDEDRWAFRIDTRGFRLWRALALGFVGYYGVAITVRKYLRPPGRRDDWSRERERDRTHVVTRWLMIATWNVLLLALSSSAGRAWMYPLLWIAPLLTVAVLFNIVRSTAEHQPPGFATRKELEPDDWAVTRTTIPGPLETWLLYQVNFNYHFEHHTWPRVPFFHLPRLHRHLVEKGFYQRHPECLQTSGLLTLLALHRGSYPPGIP
jgi:fatty acid desaturase